MDTTLYTAASGMIARQRDLDVIANNLANANVHGFRPESTFNEIWRRVGGARASARETAANTQVEVAWTYAVDRPGAMVQTRSALDVALDGDAWLAVQTKRGERYFRGGTLSLAKDGTLLGPDGLQVVGDGGPLRLTGTPEIGTDGRVRVAGAEVGRLRVARIALRDLEKEGGELYRLRPGTTVEQAAPETALHQGVLESSAVNPIEELVRMIAAQRAFEQHAKVVHLLMNEVNRRAVSEIAQL